MSLTSGPQLDLLASPAPKNDSFGVGLVGLALDQNAFFQFLTHEWLHPSRGGGLLLGTGGVCKYDAQTAPVIAVWFRVQSLPNLVVFVWRGGAWVESTLREIKTDDLIVSWTGPLPAFAVDHYVVESEAVKIQLLALARNFDDMDVPTQPIQVGFLSHAISPEDAPPEQKVCHHPQNWDALRGAATMAVHAVPAIDPWIELLCQSLQGDKHEIELAEQLHAPWLRTALWSNEWPPKLHIGLWCAIVAELSRPGLLKEWRPKAILEAICTQAQDLGENPQRLQRLKQSALDLLNDLGTVENLGLKDDNLALTLQLLLLRPSPEKFNRWREDWPAIPPAVWWTGMILAGYLQGYQALPKYFRGTAEARRLLALKTWQLACKDGASPWLSVTPTNVTWLVEGEAIYLTADTDQWAEHKIGTRGRWYRANLNDESTRLMAEALVQQACPGLTREVVSFSDSTFTYGSDGIVKIDTKQRTLSVKGRVEIPLGDGVIIEKRLDVDRFRNWMATASINQRIGRPPSAKPDIGRGHAELLALPAAASKRKNANDKNQVKSDANKKRATRTKTDAQVASPPQGLTILPEFISLEDEEHLISVIDSLEWNQSMKRRVQHYGWLYDYRSRTVDRASYLGPLPDWTQGLADRLLALGVVQEMPDQVIVNNYDGEQGISKHIDCLTCFRGPIVTVSLLETWDMVFSRSGANGDKLRFVQPLPRRSATVMDGESRSVWYHEIPERKTANGLPRVRRVSITFRKVAK